MRQYSAVIAATFAAWCAGCLPANPPPMSAVDRTKLFEDVPVMAGFSYQSGSSMLSVGRTQRMCVLKYTGKADMLSVVKYYNDSMRANQWEQDFMRGIDPIVMQFNKSEETALVLVQNLKHGEVSLIIQLFPKEKALQPPE